MNEVLIEAWKEDDGYHWSVEWPGDCVTDEGVSSPTLEFALKAAAAAVPLNALDNE